MLRICVLVGVAICGTEICACGQVITKLAVGRDLQLSVSGSTGVAVTIETTTNLSPPAWTILTNTTLVSNSLSLCTILPTDGQRFFRVQPPPVPNPAPDKLVWIPPGTFSMGSPTNEGGRWPSEGPQTVVTLTKGFYMSKYLVTQADYMAVIGTNPSRYAGVTNRPVEQVDWHSATNYCFQLSQRELLAGRLPQGWVYRLPTEAEWEYACRAGTTTRFSFGDDPGYALLGAFAWYFANSGTPPTFEDAAPHPVGTKPPNAWGLYDMHGNAAGWCWDGHVPYPGGSVTNWVCPISGSRPLAGFRGGSWGSDPWQCRSANRGYTHATDVHQALGFRVILAPEQQ